MNTKIQELTDIIYNEGVAKGQAQADQILAQAQEQAQKLIQDARKEEEPWPTLTNSGRRCARCGRSGGFPSSSLPSAWR